MDKEFDMELARRFLKMYQRADKKGKGEMLSQYCSLTDKSRDVAIKRFNRQLMLSPATKKADTCKCRRGRPRVYNRVHDAIVKECWQLAGLICAEKLHPMLDVYIEQLLNNNMLSHYSLSDIETTRAISLGTLKNIIKDFPRPATKRHKGNAFIYQKVPIIADFGKYSYIKPGYIEVDFVEHNGGSSSGAFAVTGIYTDLYSQWTVRAGGYGKNLQSVAEIDKIAHEKIPFDCLHYHPDNDKAILRILFERVRENPVVKLSRSRPYKKNDNAHVEQKGGDKVRKLIGYFRFDTEIEVKLLNKIYKQADLIDNYFIACAKLKEKVKDSKGKTIKKVYEPPMTPYQRLMLCNEVPDELKRRLKKIYERLNMVELKQEMDRLIEELINSKLGVYTQTKKKFHGQKLLSIQ